MVGDIIGEGAAQESAVVGETPNLAARLQSLADKDSVLISPGMRNLVGVRFAYESLGNHSLKGIAEPVHVWKVNSSVATESRFDAAHREGFTPLVGREQEIGLLMDRWEQAKEGDGQVVLLSGESGIGKSRITEALRERTANDNPTRLRYQCSPFYTNTALHPVVTQLELAARFDAQDTASEKLEKFNDFLAANTNDVARTVALFALLLSIPTDEQFLPLGVSAERQQELTLNALIAQLDLLSFEQPVLLLFEDIHWADPTSLEMLELVVERTQNTRVLSVLTYRPKFIPPWGGHTHLTSLTLNRFSRNLAKAMVDKVTGGMSLPDEVLKQIIEKTDGVPLFVEELTKPVIESDAVKPKAGRYVLDKPLASIVIPATLQDSLMARLDRLGQAKDIAQIAAVIGREFSRDLLEAVVGVGANELAEALTRLADVGLVFRRGTQNRSSYVFKHALVQDTAYASLLNTRRRELHGKIAQTLESDFTTLVSNEPELVAYHLNRAGLVSRAIDFSGEKQRVSLRRILPCKKPTTISAPHCTHNRHLNRVSKTKSFVSTYSARESHQSWLQKLIRVPNWSNCKKCDGSLSVDRW